MNKQKIITEFRRQRYKLRYEYLTLNNIVIAIALLIAASWAWGSVSVMQRNFKFQRSLDSKRQQLKLVELQVEKSKLEQEYYKSTEYQELTARDRLGLALPGEKLLILPKNSQTAKDVDIPNSNRTNQSSQPSNFQQWMIFLSGANAKRLQ
jgi:hypothetical protein